MKVYNLIPLVDLPRIIVQLMNLLLHSRRLLIYHKIVVISTCPRCNNKISSRSQCFKTQGWEARAKLCLTLRNLNKCLLTLMMTCQLMKAKVKFICNKWLTLVMMVGSMALKRWVTTRTSSNRCHHHIMCKKDQECKHNNK